MSSSDSEKWIEQLEDADFWTKVLAYFQRMQNLQKSSVQITLKGMESEQIMSRDAKQMQASVESISNAMKTDEKRSVTAGAVDMLRKYEQPIIDPDTNKKMSVDDFLAKIKSSSDNENKNGSTEYLKVSKFTLDGLVGKYRNYNVTHREFRLMDIAVKDKEFYDSLNPDEKKVLDRYANDKTRESDQDFTVLCIKYQTVRYNRIIDEYDKTKDLSSMHDAIYDFSAHDLGYDTDMPLGRAKEFMREEADRRVNAKPDDAAKGPELNKAQLQALVSALNSLSDAKSTSSQQKNQSVQSALGEIQALITQITNTINAKNEAKKGIASNTGR
ncbi:hypothetical protein CF104_20170 [Aeromonas jandaei]|nr:hypothetical protein CF104_20170 [Aeromonas jandaei]